MQEKSNDVVIYIHLNLGRFCPSSLRHDARSFSWMNFCASDHRCDDGYSIPPILNSLLYLTLPHTEPFQAILSLFRMSDYHNENVEASQICRSQSNPVSPQEKISPAPSLEPTTHQDFQASKGSLKDGTTLGEGDLGLEAAQSSTEGGSEESSSRGRRGFTQYRIIFHLCIWLIMTGSVLF